MERNIRKATTEDYKKVMDIPEGEILYGGDDYLPSEYHTLINWNGAYVLEISNKIVGFMAYEITDHSTCCIPFAGRISPSVRGQGLLKYLLEEGTRRIKTEHPTVRTIRMSIHHLNPFHDRIQKSHDHIHTVLFFNLSLRFLRSKTWENSGNLFKVMDEDDLQKVCDDKAAVRNLSFSGYMLVNWRYYRFDKMEAKNLWKPYDTFYCIGSYATEDTVDEITVLTLITISLRGSPGSTNYFRLLGLDVHSTLLTRELLLDHVAFVMKLFHEKGIEYEKVRITVSENYQDLFLRVFRDIEDSGKTLCFESDA